MRYRFGLVLALGLGILAWQPAAADDKTMGDVVSGLVTFGALGYTWMVDDKEGSKQLIYSTAVGYGINGALRLAFNQHEWSTRPNGHPYGFPSGHIGYVAPSAVFLRERYGIWHALPAYLGTAYVAWVRVDTGYHRWRDIAAAMVIAEGVGLWMVDDYEKEQTVVAPMLTDRYVGLSLSRQFGGS
jgi:hypothetical protein